MLKTLLMIGFFEDFFDDEDDEVEKRDNDDAELDILDEFVVDLDIGSRTVASGLGEADLDSVRSDSFSSISSSVVL